MVDTTEAMESQYLTADLVKESKTKRITFMDEGKFEEVDFGEGNIKRLTLTVEIDGRPKIYRPNKDSVRNLSAAFGKDTKDWHLRSAICQILRIQGKDCILARPVIESHEKADES